MSSSSSSSDVLYESELSRDPTRVKVWISYLTSKSYNSSFSLIEKAKVQKWRQSVYERAITAIPGSYKLWWLYTKELTSLITSNKEQVSSLQQEEKQKEDYYSTSTRTFKAILPNTLSTAILKAHGYTNQTYLPDSFQTYLSSSALIIHTSLIDHHHNSKTITTTTTTTDYYPPPLTVSFLNDLFERSLILHSKKPRLWLAYCAFLKAQGAITRTRRTFDRALRSLPITQHEPIWKDILHFSKNCGVDKTAMCLYRRCLMVCPDRIQEYIDYLFTKHKWDECAQYMAKAINEPRFANAITKTSHQIWMEVCDLITNHPSDIRSISVEQVLRCGLLKFTEEVGRLWCSLAEHFIRLGKFERARDIYEEAVTSVCTVHDFALAFDAYAAFEEQLVVSSNHQDQTSSPEADIYLSRLERLMDRRGELVSSVKLRQNPHNVYEWLTRTKLFSNRPLKVVESFSDAVRTIDPTKAVGRLQVLWIKFAHYYEKFGDVDNARLIFKKGTQIAFRGIDELAAIWCEWVEMELRHKQYSKALQVARQAVYKPTNAASDSVHARLYRSVKLWSMVVDMEENFGTLETLRTCYDKMFTLKVVTPQLVINYAQHLQELKYFEESFRAYERGISLFRWPHLSDIYLIYLTKVVERFGHTKLERARELFEQAVADAPPKYARRLYLLYAKLEEEFGLAKHALKIYDRACKVVPDDQKYDMYVLYIAKTAELFGVVKARPIYEEAIEELPDNEVKKMCLQYSEVEKGLGEIERARSVYVHASQFADPSTDVDFWRVWREFEVAHGNEDTFRDMLRVKRSVRAQYTQIHINAA